MKGNGLGEKSETGQCVGGALITYGCSGPDKRGRDGTDVWAGASVEDSRLNPRLGSLLRLGLIFVSRVYLFRASISSLSPCVLLARLFRFYRTYFGLSRYLDT